MEDIYNAARFCGENVAWKDANKEEKTKERTEETVDWKTDASVPSMSL